MNIAEPPYLDHVTLQRRWKRVTDLKVRLDLIRLHDLAQALAPAVPYETVLRHLLLSARHGEFGFVEQRHRRQVRELLHLDLYNEPPGAGCFRLPIWRIEEVGIRYLWARKPVLTAWTCARGWSVPPWLVGPPSAPSAAKTKRRGPSARPIWVAGERFIDLWLDDEGCPGKNDGEQARLERAVADYFSSRGIKLPAVSTIRDHVTAGMGRYRERHNI